MDDQQQPSHRNLDPDLFTILAATFEFGMVPLAWFVVWSWPGSSLPTARWSFVALLVGIGATVPPLLVFAVLTFTRVRDLPPIARIRNRVQEILGETLSRLQIWQILLVSISAGVGEEVLFRGALVSRLGDGLIGACLAGIVFGLLHWITPVYAVLASIFGVFLGWLFLVTDNLFVPMVVHALYDLVALVVLRRELRKHGFPDKITPEAETSEE